MDGCERADEDAAEAQQHRRGQRYGLTQSHLQRKVSRSQLEENEAPD